MKPLHALLPIWLAVSSFGCNSYDGFDLERTTTPPGEVSVTSSSVVLPQGVAVGVRVLAPGAEDPETGDVTAAMRSSNPVVLQVWPTTEQNTFVLCGGSEGTATITVLIDGQDDESIPAVVGTPQKATVP
jgi:hypothetical protein